MLAPQMSRRTFIENVVNLVVENCLICDIPSILTPKKVNRMSEETLRDLASESHEVLLKREVLQEQTRTLREGLRICQQHRRREMTGTRIHAPSYRTLTPNSVFVIHQRGHSKAAEAEYLKSVKVLPLALEYTY